MLSKEVDGEMQQYAHYEKGSFLFGSQYLSNIITSENNTVTFDVVGVDQGNYSVRTIVFDEAQNQMEKED